MLYVCIFESINTQRYLNRGETHYRNRTSNRRDILIITLFVDNHASLSSHSIHFFHPVSLIFPFSFHISVHRNFLSFTPPPLFAHLLSHVVFHSTRTCPRVPSTSLYENIPSHDSLKKKKKEKQVLTIITSKSSFTFPCDEREIRLSSRNGHENGLHLHSSKTHPDENREKREESNVCILADARWLSRRVEIIMLRRTKLIKN